MNAPMIEQLPIGKIKPAKDNHRADVGDIAELAQSISSVGLLEPIIVTQQNGGYEVVAGHRRLAACKLAGSKTIDAIVRKFATPADRTLAMAIENLQREDLSVLEEARAYKQLLEQLGCSQRELAPKVGKTQSHISKRLALLELPEKAQSLVDSGGITVAVALELGKLAKHPARIQEVLDEIPADGQVQSEDVAWEIEQQLGKIRTLEKVARSEKAIAASGVHLLTVKRDSLGRVEFPKGATTIAKGGGYDALKLDPDKHANEPCHAAYVDAHGEIVYVCTDRNRHPKLKTDSEQFRSTANARAYAQRKEQQELRAAAKARHEFVKSVVSSKTLTGYELTEHVVEAFVAASHQTTAKLACEFLGIEPPRCLVFDAFYASTDYNGALRAHAAKGDKEALQVLAALVAGTHEGFMTGSYSNWDRDGPKAYVRWLEQRGHKLAPIEAKKLEPQAA